MNERVGIKDYPEQRKHARTMPSEQLLLQLTRVHNAYQLAVLPIFKQHHLTQQQYNVLRILYVRGDAKGIAICAIKELLLDRVPDTSRLIDRMEKANLVERIRAADDRRVVLVRATELGNKLRQHTDQGLVDFFIALEQKVDLSNADICLAQLDKLLDFTQM